jgi:hypothetical protein
MRRIRLAPEYNTTSVWELYDDGGSEDIEPAELPISPGLQRDLTAWSAAWQSTFAPEYPPESSFPSADAEATFRRAGRELARRLADELNGIAEVSYSSMLDD